MNSESHPAHQEVSNTIAQIDLLNEVQALEGQRQALQQELDSLKQRFEGVLKATRDAAWEWDLQHTIIWYGDGIKLLFGYDWADQIVPVSLWNENIHAEHRERVINSLNDSLKLSIPNWVERYRFKRDDGSFAWVLDRGYIIHNESGVPIKMVGSMQDITAEVEAKDALRESEEKFRGAFDHLAVGVSIADPQGHFLSVNKAYPKIFGYSEEEIKTKRISDLSHPDEIEGDRKIIQHLLSGKPQLNVREKRYLHKSGKVIWGRVFGTVIKDANGNPKYFVGVLEDVTAQREVAQALHESAERLRLAIDSAKLGTWDLDPLTGKLFWDDRCKELFGLEPSDYVDYEVFLQGLHPDDRSITDKTNQDALNGVGDGNYNLEYRTIGIRDQTLRWVRAKGRSHRDENGITTRYAGTVLDITEEKKHQQELRKQEERFRLLATCIPQIVWTTDENGIVDYMSENWTRYTGAEPTFKKFSFRELIHPDDLEKVISEWSICMKEGITFVAEYRLINLKTGEYRWYSCTTAPLKDDQGVVVKWIGSATDVHDQKLTEFRLEEKVAERTKELQQLNEQLEKSNDELQQYAYVTSHDLKEPLRKIRTFSDRMIIKHKAELSKEAADYLDKINTAASRMSTLIEDLLAYSKLSNTEVAFTQINLNEVLEKIRTELDFVLSEKNVSITIEQLPVIEGVPVQIQQLFYNLITNAIKFSKPGIRNTITVKSSSLDMEEQLDYALSARSKYYKISVKDEGIGFSQEYSEKIFTIFNRLHTSRDYEGHGIGLALCRKIVSNHKGFILAEGEEQRGATFTVILPAHS